MCARGEESKARERSTRARPPISSRLSCISRACTASSQPSSLRPPARPPARARSLASAALVAVRVVHERCRSRHGPPRTRAGRVYKINQIRSVIKVKIHSHLHPAFFPIGAVTWRAQGKRRAGAVRAAKCMSREREQMDAPARLHNPRAPLGHQGWRPRSHTHPRACVCLCGVKKGGVRGVSARVSPVVWMAGGSPAGAHNCGGGDGELPAGGAGGGRRRGGDKRTGTVFLGRRPSPPPHPHPPCRSAGTGPFRGGTLCRFARGLSPGGRPAMENKPSPQTGRGVQTPRPPGEGEGATEVALHAAPLAFFFW